MSRLDMSVVNSVRDKLCDFLRIPVLLIALCSLLGYLSGFGYIFDLLCHFRVQYFFVLLIYLTLLRVSRRMKESLLIGLCLLLNFASIAYLYLPSENYIQPVSDQEEVEVPFFRVMLVNVHYQTKDFARLVHQIRDTAPDVLVLEEATPECLQTISKEFFRFRYKEGQVFNDTRGMYLLSKWPLEKARVSFLQDNLAPQIVANVFWEGKPITVIASHPCPPVSASLYDLREAQIKQIIDAKNDCLKSIIVVGDLNTTSWSASFDRLVTSLNLVNSQRGFGVCPSWPAPLPLFQIPLDHILFSPDLKIQYRAVLPDIGSDHLPVIADFRRN